MTRRPTSPRPTTPQPTTRRPAFRRPLAAVAATGILAFGLSAPQAAAQELSLQSAFPSGLAVLSESIAYFADRVNTLSGGDMTVTPYDVGTLSPPFEVLENVGIGAIDMAWSYAGYWQGSMPAAALYGSIPFGPDAPKYLSWINHGGGAELWRELYADSNVVPMACGAIISEAGGWYREEISAPDDFQGMNFRIGGLGGRILEKLGAVPQSLPAGETYLALETGRLDGTELSFPAIDVSVGFNQVAPYYYFPGWHQPSGLIELLINADLWNAMDEAERLLIETACAATNAWSVEYASVIQADALDRLEADGAIVQRYPDSVLTALREAAVAVYEEAAAEDEMFARVLDSYRTFSAIYDAYRDLSALEGIE